MNDDFDTLEYSLIRPTKIWDKVYRTNVTSELIKL